MKKIIALLFLAVVLGMGQIRPELLPKTNLPYADKMVHVSLYAGGSTLLLMGGISPGTTLLTAIGAGVLDESIQPFAKRNRDWKDLLANCVGCALALTVFHLQGKKQNSIS